MAQVDKQSGGIIISQNLAAANTVTTTLITPAAGQVNRILWIACYAAAATAADVHITKSDATSIARLGGAGIGILSAPLVFDSANQPRGGLTGYTADGTLVVLTTTAGTNTECTVGYVQVPA